jgi:hypothetical protein
MLNIQCRPELHRAITGEQYAEFHGGMQELGFERTITRNGKTEHLPTGEYVGLNLSSSLNVLALKIDVLARRISGYRCKMTLTPISGPEAIYTYGLEEDNSFSTQLGRLIGESMAKAPYGSFTGLNLLSGSKR